MATTPAAEAWINAERRCFAYLLENLEGQKDVTAFGAPDYEIPLKVNSNSKEDCQMWTFRIEGPPPVGEDELYPKSNNHPGAWNFGGVIEAVFLSRERAQRFAMLVRDALPVNAGGAITGITFLCYSGKPSLERSVLFLKSDQSTGGEIRVWKVTQPLVVVFSNTKN